VSLSEGGAEAEKCPASISRESSRPVSGTPHQFASFYVTEATEGASKCLTHMAIPCGDGTYSARMLFRGLWWSSLLWPLSGFSCGASVTAIKLHGLLRMRRSQTAPDATTGQSKRAALPQSPEAYMCPLARALFAIRENMVPTAT
jgi:hypothetical protein